MFLCYQFEYGNEKPLEIRWCHLCTIPGTTPHCLVNTEGNINFLGTTNLVYNTAHLNQLMPTDHPGIGSVTFENNFKINQKFENHLKGS